MQGRISSIQVKLTSEQQDILTGLLRRSTIPTGLGKRARAVPIIDAATYHQECISDRQMSKPSMLL